MAALITRDPADASTVIEFYATTPATQADRHRRLLELARADRQVRSSSVHRSRDGVRLAEYVQLAGDDTLGALRRRRDLAWPGRPVTDSHAYRVVVSVPVERAPVIDPGVLIAFGEFWLDPADQDELIARESSVVGQALAVDGMLSVNFHRGLDGTRMVNLAQLASPDTVERLAAAPTFAAGTAYWRGLARNAFHLYDVTVAVDASG